MLAKAVVKRSEALKNLQKVAGSQETVLMNLDVQACKVDIEQTQQMLVVGRLGMNRTKVLLYRTMVLMARLTKVRC
jgi:hypothetical protein